MAWKVAAALSAVLIASVTVACSPLANDSTTNSSEVNERAADSTGFGPSETTSAEYRMDASTDPDILTDRKTEIWARMWRPKTMASGEKHPLLVFLHGNHGTCGTGSNPRVDDNTQYTNSGTCPSGYVPTPNHMGYAYLAERLASWGYIVVSINANRGITAGSPATGDSGVNLARGRLILKHLQLLSQWNANPGTTPASLGADLAGAIDFENVGMMGHSRGGEGVRAAYTQYHDSGSAWPTKIATPVNFKAIFEIGPVDGQTSRTLNALGTAWNVILPMCDGDVSNLQGMKPFDRMMAASSESAANAKGLFAVWGANHNYFNTEWQQSDSRGCSGVNHNPLFDLGPTVSGSTKQQQVGLHALMGFFRAHVGAHVEPALNNAYDPQYGLPETLERITHIERAYADAADASQMTILEDFTKANGTALSGAPEVIQNATITHGSVSEHDAVLKAANVKWTNASADSFYQIPFAASGVDASNMKTFDFRISRQARGTDLLAEVNFSVRLVGTDGSLSQPASLKEFLQVAPAGGHSILETARIPLSAFGGADLTKVAGVRFTFDGSANGAVYLSSVRFSRATPASGPVTEGRPAGTGENRTGSSEPVTIATGNSVVDLRAATPGSSDVEVELASASQFPVMDELVHLRVGDQDIVQARYADDGNTGKIVFKLSADQFNALPDAAPMKVQYGEAQPTRQYEFGQLLKGNVRR